MDVPVSCVLTTLSDGQLSYKGILSGMVCALKQFGHYLLGCNFQILPIIPYCNGFQLKTWRECCAAGPRSYKDSISISCTIKAPWMLMLMHCLTLGTPPVLPPCTLAKPHISISDLHTAQHADDTISKVFLIHSWSSQPPHDWVVSTSITKISTVVDPAPDCGWCVASQVHTEPNVWTCISSHSP